MIIDDLVACFGLLTRRQKRDFLIVVVAMSMAALMELLGVAVVIPLVSILIDYEAAISSGVLRSVHLFLGGPEKELFLMVVMLSGVLMVFTSGAVTIISIYLNQRYLKRINAELSTKIYIKFMSQNLAEFHSRSSAEFARNVNGVSERVSQGVIGVTIIIASRAFQVLFVAAVLLYVNAAVASAVVSIITISYVSVFILVRKRIVLLSNKNFDEVREVQQLVIGSYQGYKSITIDGLLPLFADRFHGIKKMASRRAANIEVIGAIPKNIIEVVGVSSLLVSAYFIGVKSDNSYAFVSVLGLFGIAAYRLLPSAQQLYHASNRLIASLAVFRAVSKQWGGDQYRAADSVPAPVPTKLDYFRVCNVTYFYGDQKVYDDLSLEIPLKGIVRISGKSGVGKSTLFELLLGLRMPVSGVVLVNDSPLSKIDIKQLWTKISYVSQKGYVFKGSIKSNVVLNECNIDSNRLNLVANICGLNTLCSSNVFDPELEVSESGLDLSGGEANRLLLARGLYKQSEILMLDEALASLDPDSAREILQKISTTFPDRVLLLISHREEEVPRKGLVTIALSRE
tara:strand:+ start:5570 stop:7276 length:1707 start_codon:yes stop_codon:yes gene_type:complete